MSSATSIRGKKHEEIFRIGFQHQNKSEMVDGIFKESGKLVYGKKMNGNKDTNQLLGDIDGCYVSSVDINLRNLLPNPHRFSHNYFIKRGDHVFFEVTTQSGDELWKNPFKYMKKKFEFHSKLVKNEGFDFPVDCERHVLIFVYNGADNVEVDNTFRNLCLQYSIRGATVYLSSDTVSQWDLTLQLDAAEAEILAERNRATAERNRATAAEAEILAERNRATAAEAEILELKRKILFQENTTPTGSQPKGQNL
jgi:hypothetical protein